MLKHGGRGGRRSARDSANFILQNLDEIWTYEILEDDYDCSGMCKSSLFYFSKELHEGSPKQTCLLEFKEYIAADMHTFGSILILASLVALFTFFAHFGMYCRPLGNIAPTDAIELPRSSNIHDEGNSGNDYYDNIN